MALLIAQTKHGVVEGLRCGNHRVSVFKGIPYALPPIGELRWKPPMPAPDWPGVLRAYCYSKIPVQPPRPEGTFYQKHFFPDNQVERSEDCLYLNIWTPAKSPDEKLPVAFWIYGGGFTTGYANKIEFDGEAFAKRGCLFVSFNYRVGLMGFLAHPELSAENAHHVSGNYGILDQIAALKWVRENIAAFGGDPDNITIFGQSAGAMSCTILCNSPLTQGMFRRAICESCGGLNIKMFRENRQSLEDAERLGISVLHSLGLKNISEARLENACQLANRLGEMPQFAFAKLMPCIDGYVLPLSPTVSIMQNRHQKVDYMVGATANEGYGFNVGTPYDPKVFVEEAKNCYGSGVDAFLEAVHYEPGGKERPTDMFGDAMMAAGIAWNELELRRGGNTCYQYLFTKTVPGEESGAFHSAEHAYIFQTLNRFEFPYQGSDYMLSNMMCDYWCNFIKTGNPNGSGLPVWKKYQTSDKKLMELGEHVGMIEIPQIPGTKFAVEYILREAENEVTSN